MLAYFAQASGPLQCLSNRSTSANSKTALLVGQIFQWRGWENKANCYMIDVRTEGEGGQKKHQICGQTVQSRAAYHSLGFEDKNLGSSPEGC